MKEALEDALRNLRVSIDENNAVVTSDTLPKVNGDLSQMTLLLQNLIGNAIKFRGEAQPEIHISVRRETGRFIFGVKDNGIGIEPGLFRPDIHDFSATSFPNAIPRHRNRPCSM